MPAPDTESDTQGVVPLRLLSRGPIQATPYLLPLLRAPGHVMRATNSLCIEGTVLFATVMEGIGLKPVIVLVPGHAFVGWHDPEGPVQFKGSRLYLLETTSIGRHDFETALQFAQDHFERQRKFLEQGTDMSNEVLDIHALRSKGYKPQPYPD